MEKKQIESDITERIHHLSKQLKEQESFPESIKENLRELYELSTVYNHLNKQEKELQSNSEVLIQETVSEVPEEFPPREQIELLEEEIKQPLAEEKMEVEVEEKEVAEIEEYKKQEATVIDSVEPVIEEVLQEQVQASAAQEQVVKASGNSEKSSLAEQFMNKGISDLKQNIGISEKFMFIHELFNGNTEKYLKEIEYLNNCANWEKADKRLGQLKKELAWPEESEAMEQLENLVTRKYQ